MACMKRDRSVWARDFERFRRCAENFGANMSLTLRDLSAKTHFKERQVNIYQSNSLSVYFSKILKF